MEEKSLIIRCEIRRSPLYRVMPGGIEAKCKSCRGAIHVKSRKEIQRIWSKASEETIRCEVWDSPLYRVVPGGIEAKCRSCRGEIHFKSREEIENAWRSMNEQEKEGRDVLAGLGSTES